MIDWMNTIYSWHTFNIIDPGQNDRNIKVKVSKPNYDIVSESYVSNNGLLTSFISLGIKMINGFDELSN